MKPHCLLLAVLALPIPALAGQTQQNRQPQPKPPVVIDLPRFDTNRSQPTAKRRAVENPATLLGQPRAIQGDLKPEDIYKSVLPSIVTLTVERRDGTKIFGTAFLAIKDGLAITAWHVVRNAKRVIAKFASGEEYDVTGIIDQDEKRDIVLVRIKTVGKPLLRLSKIDRPSIGSKVYVVGAPKGFEFSFSDGLLSQIQNIDRVNYYQFTCPASPGNSGGPLINSKGEALGIVSRQYREGQNLNFAIPSTYALALDATLPTLPWEVLKTEEEDSKARSVRGAIDEIAGTYTGSWVSSDYNVSGNLVMIILITGNQPQVQVVLTGSEYLNEEKLSVKMTPMGAGVWKMDYTGERSKIAGTGLFKAGNFVGDYRFRKLLLTDRGKWVVTKQN